jgi:hypothetical protein
MSNAAVITSIEPPGLPKTALDFDEPDVIEVQVALSEADETVRTASVTLPSNASDGDIADAFVRCLNGCAVMRGPGLAKALQRLVRAR